MNQASIDRSNFNYLVWKNKKFNVLDKVTAIREFNKIDTNHDNKIEASEFTAYVKKNADQFQGETSSKNPKAKVIMFVSEIAGDEIYNKSFKNHETEKANSASASVIKNMQNLIQKILKTKPGKIEGDMVSLRNDDTFTQKITPSLEGKISDGMPGSKSDTTNMMWEITAKLQLGWEKVHSIGKINREIYESFMGSFKLHLLAADYAISKPKPDVNAAMKSVKTAMNELSTFIKANMQPKNSSTKSNSSNKIDNGNKSQSQGGNKPSKGKSK